MTHPPNPMNEIVAPVSDNSPSDFTHLIPNRNLRKPTAIPCVPHRHSRVGGNPQGGVRPARHTGFKAVSTGFKAVSIERCNTSSQSSKSPHRHSRVGGNPQGGSVTRVNKSKTTAKIPSPLMAEGQSLSQCLTLGAEGE